MPTDCKTRPQRDCSYFTPIPDDEISVMQNFKAGELKVKAGTAILIEGANSLQLYTVLSGMACATGCWKMAGGKSLISCFPPISLGCRPDSWVRLSIHWNPALKWSYACSTVPTCGACSNLIRAAPMI